MKTLAILSAAILATCSTVIGAIPWTHTAEEGEDATSTHYYFYQSNGESVVRVRWIWNGGAQNAPTVTEYLLDAGVITIRHLSGKREAIEALITGEDVELELKEQYSIAAKSTSEMLVPPQPDTALSDKQRIDLKNLIDLLAKERKPQPRQNKRMQATGVPPVPDP